MKALCMLFVIIFATTLRGSDQRDFKSLETGNDFLRQCDASSMKTNDLIARGEVLYCLGFIQGFLEGHEVSEATGWSKPQFCFPSNADYGQASRVIQKWLRENPEKDNMPISLVAQAALVQAFPCAK